MSIYDYNAIGACGPNTGCPPYGYGYGYAPPAYPMTYAGPGQVDLMGGWPQYDLVGQPVTPPPEPGVWDKTKQWLQQETLGIKRQNLLLGAAAVTGIWWAYGAGYLGGSGGRGRRDASFFGF